MGLLDKVQKHMKTLLKYLADQVATTKDPNVIEHTNRQIRSIENLKADVKFTIKMQMKKKGVDSDMFVMSVDSCTDGRASMSSTSNLKMKTEDDSGSQIPAKRKRIEISNAEASDAKDNFSKPVSKSGTPESKAKFVLQENKLVVNADSAPKKRVAKQLEKTMSKANQKLLQLDYDPDTTLRSALTMVSQKAKPSE